jgi:hypothetical protein
MPRRNRNARRVERGRCGAVITIDAAPRRMARITVAEGLDIYLAALRDGSALSAASRPYKPAAIDKYQRIAERTLKPKLGRYVLCDLQRHDIHRFVDTLRAERTGTGTIHATLDLLRAVYHDAIKRGEARTDPTSGAGSRLAKAA